MDEAKHIATTLIEKKLAACINIIPQVQSIYWWGNTIQQDDESILLVKTMEHCFDALTTVVEKLHSYKTPCILSLPILHGHPAFLSWINISTQKDH